MKKKFWMISALTACSIGLMACEDEQVQVPVENITTEVHCLKGQNRCGGDVAITCVDGFYEIEDCASKGKICFAAKCIEKEPEGNTNCEPACVDGVLLSCDNNTTALVACGENKECGEIDGVPACVDKPVIEPSCTDAENKCENGILTKCGETGLIETPCSNTQMCGTDADGKPACVDKCTEALNTCLEGTLSECQADGTMKDSACAEDEVCGIVEGKPACVKAATCSEDDNNCAGGVLTLCVDGNLTKTACSDGLVCGTDADGKPACVQPQCTEADAKCENNTLTTCTNGMITTHVCKENEECGTVEDRPACVLKADVTCSESDNKCENGILFTCTNGSMTSQNCGEGYECNPDGTASCTEKVVVPVCTDADNKCENNSLTLCADNALTTTACTGNTMCGTDAEGKPACVEIKCTTADNKCENNSLTLCENNALSTTACTSTQMCGTENGKPACVEKTINTQDQWIGAPCSCSGSGCEAMGVPLPAPTKNATINGCDNIDVASYPGGALACLTTITSDLAPAVYFPAGYCAISAVGCKKKSGIGDLCGTIEYGDASKLTTCPSGSALVESVFDQKILLATHTLTNKTCTKMCNTDADCNTAGEVSCLEKNGVKICQNAKNFEFMGDNITVTPFW